MQALPLDPSSPLPMLNYTPLFIVEKPGLLTTVQDLGRYGHQQFGISPAGAMDPFALQVGNILVGNNRSEAALEVSFQGPQLRFLSDATIAICGGDLTPRLDGVGMVGWTRSFVRQGQLLTFGPAREGARAYICVAGGLDIPLFLGSKATYLRAEVGGYRGRPLVRGDILSAPEGPNGPSPHLPRRRLHPACIPHYSNDLVLRFIAGPHQAAFTSKGLATFLSTPYTITPQSDRMGYRLKGAPIDLHKGKDLISMASPMGLIQIPPDGLPIILMADRQTTGGYPCMGTIIAVDIPFLAQARPGCKISFKGITVDAAHALYREQALLLERLDMAAHY